MFGYNNTIIDLNKKLEDWRVRYSVYPYNGFTVNEILMQFYDSVKTCIDSVSTYNKLIDEFVKWAINEGLEKEIIKQLETWKNDGTLNNIINKQIFSDLNNKISTNENAITELKQSDVDIKKTIADTNKSLQAFNIDLDNKISAVDKKIFTMNLVADVGEDISDKLQKMIDSNTYNTVFYGIKIVLPVGRYKLSKTITITTPNIIIQGQGTFITTLECQMSSGSAFDIQGKSGGKWLNGIQLCHFSLEGGTQYNNSAIYMRQVGLNSHINNIGIYYFKGIGIQTHSCFDMNFSFMEIRGCGGFGILNMEQNKHNFPTLPFEETSYLRFNNVVVVDCNSRGVQWEIRGGNSYFINNCKVNEGTTGINIKHHTSRTFIDKLYMDGVDTRSVVINIENSDCREFNISNLTTWNVDTAVQADGVKALTLGDCCEMYGGSKHFTPFELTSTCENCNFIGTLWYNYQYQNMPMKPMVTFGGRYKDNVLQNFTGAEIYVEYREFSFTAGSNLHHFKITKDNFKILHMSANLHNFSGLVTNDNKGNMSLVSRTYEENGEWWVEIRLSNLNATVWQTTPVNFSVTMFGYHVTTNKETPKQ